MHEHSPSCRTLSYVILFLSSGQRAGQCTKIRSVFRPPALNNATPDNSATLRSIFLILHGGVVFATSRRVVINNRRANRPHSNIKALGDGIRNPALSDGAGISRATFSRTSDRWLLAQAGCRLRIARILPICVPGRYEIASSWKVSPDLKPSDSGTRNGCVEGHETKGKRQSRRPA